MSAFPEFFRPLSAFDVDLYRLPLQPLSAFTDFFSAFDVGLYRLSLQPLPIFFRPLMLGSTVNFFGCHPLQPLLIFFRPLTLACTVRYFLET